MDFGSTKQKRIAAIHDLSGFGKCSLTVALPIVSATGVECACIPTALLSTHTGGFSEWTFHDLSGQLVPIANHWKKLGIHFNGIYTGYLASPEQGRLLDEAIDLIRSEDTIIIVDPAMADNGMYYSNLDERMTFCFRKLIAKADVITPNITEACFITGIEYTKSVYSLQTIDEILDRLQIMGAKIPVITGVSIEANSVGVVARDELGATFCVMSPAREGTFHGSGDVFASAFSAMYVRGASVRNAIETAVNFTADCIMRTENNHTPRQYGLDFENAIPDYVKRVSELF